MKIFTTQTKHVFLLIAALAAIKTTAQCISPTQYPSGTVTIANPGSTTVTTCNYAGEYSIDNFTATGTYVFSSTGGTGNFLTITNNSNAVIASGYSPLTVVISSTGLYRTHIALNPSCSSESACRTTVIASTTVCTSSSNYPSGTVTIGSSGTTTVTTCNYAGEYSLDNFPTSGIYTINVTGGTSNYVTVKNSAGTVIYAQGVPPLQVNIPAAGVYAIHISLNNGLCGTENTCRVTQVTAPGPAPCSGTPPTPAIAISSPTGCPSAGFTITTTGGTTNSGITYTWQSASASTGPFTNVTGTTNSLVTTAATTTYYRLITTCTVSNLSSTTSVVSYSVVNPGPCVCNSYGASIATSTGDEDILGVTFGTLNNPSTCSSVGPGPGSILNRYSNYAGYLAAPNVCRGQSTAFTTTINTCGGWYGMQLAVYIDLNQNGSFADAGEQVYLNTAVIQGVTSTNISIPASALAGITRMRIVAAENTSPIAVGSYGYGETEDYCINILAPPVIALSASSGSVCPGGSFTVSASGANTYTFSGGPASLVGSTATLSPLVNTTYTAAGTATTGCIASGSLGANVALSMLAAPSLTIVPASPSICPGFSSTLAVSGANTYTWSTNTQTNNLIVTPSSTQVYTVSGTGTTVCNGVKTVTVVVNPSPTISVNSGTICSGTIFTISPSGASTYTITGGNSTTVSPSSTTSYSVTGTSGAGCISPLAAVSSVSVFALPVVTVGSTTLCGGQVYTIPMSGAVNYTLLNGTNPVNPSTTTSYSIIGSDALGCVSLPAISTVTVFTPPSVSVTATPGSTICNTSSVSLSAAGALTFTWNNTTPGTSISGTPTTTTTYFVIGTDVHGCQSGSALTVTVHPLPTVSVTANKTFYCAGASATLTAFGSSTYTWNPGNTTSNPLVINPTSTTVYSVTTDNAFGCLKTAMVSVNVNTITMGVSASTAICEGQETTLGVTGVNKVLWSNGSIFIQNPVSPTVTTTYTVAGTDVQGCAHTGSVTITVNANPPVGAAVSPTSICIGEPATLTATGATSYTWAILGAGSSFTVMPLTVGTRTYAVTGINANGCKATDTIALKLDACVGLKENTRINGLSVYPNPHTGEFTVEFANNGSATIQVYDVTGRLILNENAGSEKTVVDLREFANGVYYVKVSTAQSEERIKVIKQ